MGGAEVGSSARRRVQTRLVAPRGWQGRREEGFSQEDAVAAPATSVDSLPREPLLLMGVSAASGAAGVCVHVCCSQVSPRQQLLPGDGRASCSLIKSTHLDLVCQVSSLSHTHTHTHVFELGGVSGAPTAERDPVKVCSPRDPRQNQDQHKLKLGGGCYLKKGGGRRSQV